VMGDMQCLLIFTQGAHMSSSYSSSIGDDIFSRSVGLAAVAACGGGNDDGPPGHVDVDVNAHWRLRL